MDEAASRLRIEIDSLPQEIDEVERRIVQLEIERQALLKEKDKAGRGAPRGAWSRRSPSCASGAPAMKAQWQAEKAAIQEIQQIKAEIESAAERGRAGHPPGRPPARGGAALRPHSRARARSWRRTRRGCRRSRRKARYLKEEVDAEDIAEIVAKWTGIPVTKMLESERERLTQLEDGAGPAAWSARSRR